MSFIESSITGAIKWDIFVIYIVSGLIFGTCTCVIGEIIMVVKGEGLVPTLQNTDSNNIQFRGHPIFG